jgi:hypothetical protein
MPISRITAASIQDGTVVAADIADGTVTGQKIASTTITADKIGLNQITGNLLASGVVANASTATTFTANQTFAVANVTGQLSSFGPAFQNIIRLTDGATITMNLAQTNNFIVRLGGARVLANATNIIPGQSGSLVVQQDGTGGRTLAFGTGWRFPGNTAPTLTTTANAVDLIVYTAWSTSNVIAQAVLNVGF